MLALILGTEDLDRGGFDFFSWFGCVLQKNMRKKNLKSNP